LEASKNGSDAVSTKSYNVLFVCTGNSARSIMAEGLMNHLGEGRFKAYSAGSHPTGTVNPFALQTLAALDLPTGGYRSKSWDEYSGPDAPAMDFIITVCDNAAGEVCPVWPGQPVTAHWGVPDPAAFDGPDGLKAKEFMKAAMTLRLRIELMLALSLDKRDTMAVEHDMRAIGRH
jgi:arsenate reductase (thioredoxin)